MVINHSFNMVRDTLIRAKEVLKNVWSTFSGRLIYFGKNSGIHGLKQIFDGNAHVVSRLFWIVIMLISTGCLYMLLVPVVELGNQVNFTPDTRYLTWVTTFPAVTVCEMFQYKKSQDKLKKLYPELMDPLSFSFSKHLTELLYGRGTCSKSLCVPCGAEVSCDVPWRKMIEDVHHKCSEMLTQCRFNSQKFDCCQKFLPVDSEYGYCFSFNTLQSEHSGDEPLYTVNRTTGPGLLTFRLLYDAIISVHSPEELATNVLDFKFRFDVRTAPDKEVDYLFSTVEMENDPMMFTEDISVRACRKLGEVPKEPLHIYPVYSYGACRLAEETEHSFEECGCIHPVRHSSYEQHYCNYTGLVCLLETEVLKHRLGLDKHEERDDCLPSCVESEVTTIHISRRIRTAKELKNITGGTLVSVRMASLPNLRFIRNLVRTRLDFVVSIGGMVSLFFAASILSIVEIFYLIFRPYQ